VETKTINIVSKEDLCVSWGAYVPLSKPTIKLDQIIQYFESRRLEAFSLAELEILFVQRSGEWSLPASMTFRKFLKYLTQTTNLKELRLKSPASTSSLLRYTWGNAAPPVSIAASIKKETAFFSHASSMWIHGLGKRERHLH
jgi:hypothetical protein